VQLLNQLMELAVQASRTRRPSIITSGPMASFGSQVTTADSNVLQVGGYGWISNLLREMTCRIELFRTSFSHLKPQQKQMLFAGQVEQGTLNFHSHAKGGSKRLVFSGVCK